MFSSTRAFRLLFLAALVAMSLVVIEQNRTIASQRRLIVVLSGDSNRYWMEKIAAVPVPRPH